MKVIVTGGKGQLGVDVTAALQRYGYQVHSFGREELDITDYDNVNRVVSSVRPDAVIHTAAYTQVDKAEVEIDLAYQINALGTRNIAVAAEKVGTKVIYISTDYVFDGKAEKPYHEFSPTNPASVYGKSKLAGENYLQQFSSKFFIVRTSWVYGKYGNNFVKTILKLAEDRTELNVVHDQIGSPTYTEDLAVFIVQLLKSEQYGIYHASNSGSCSWYEFAKAIFAEANLSHVKVNPVTTAEFPRPAPRPAYSVLDHMSIRLNGMSDLPPWRDALKSFMKDYMIKD